MKRFFLLSVHILRNFNDIFIEDFMCVRCRYQHVQFYRLFEDSFDTNGTRTFHLSYWTNANTIHWAHELVNECLDYFRAVGHISSDSSFMLRVRVAWIRGKYTLENVSKWQMKEKIKMWSHMKRTAVFKIHSPQRSVLYSMFIWIRAISGGQCDCDSIFAHS